MKSCEAFADAGVAVTLVVPTKRNVLGQNAFDYFGVRRTFTLKKIPALDLIWLIPERIGFYLNALTFGISAIFYALIHCRRKDVVYSRDIVTIAALCLVGFRPVAEIHDYRSQKPKKIIQFILRHCRAVVFNSEGTKSLFIRHYSFVIPALVAPNGVDLAFFDIAQTREEARKKLGLPLDKTIIGYVGRLEVAGQSKGVPMLQEAFALMQWRDTAELLLVVAVPYKDVPLYLRAIDIAVIPYPGEQHAKTTSPIKLYEYMAAHKTIVIADSPDAREFAKKLDAAVLHPQPFVGQPPTWPERAEKILQFIS